jgi:DNA-binding NarL/FixJ family response regulator
MMADSAERVTCRIDFAFQKETDQDEWMSGANPATNRTRVLIVDDHPMTRAGLVHVINRQPDLVVCGEAENAAEALDAVGACRPDLVLADITLPGKSGLELIKDIKAIRPGLPILVISMHDESLYAERVLRAGARGYITKHEGGERLMQAVRHVLSGQIYVSEKMSAHILERFSGGQVAPVCSLVAQLSDREFEVFELLGEGLSAHEIAGRLHISTKTVDAHRANIKAKLVIKTTSELISYAARWIEHRANRK